MDVYVYTGWWHIWLHGVIMTEREQVIAWRESMADGDIIEPALSEFVDRHVPVEWVQEGRLRTAEGGVVICNMWLEKHPESGGERLRRAIREARDVE